MLYVDEWGDKIVKLIEYLKRQDYTKVCTHYRMFWEKEISTHVFEDKRELEENRKKCLSVLEKWSRDDFSDKNETILFLHISPRMCYSVES